MSGRGDTACFFEHDVVEVEFGPTVTGRHAGICSCDQEKVIDEAFHPEVFFQHAVSDAMPIG